LYRHYAYNNVTVALQINSDAGTGATRFKNRLPRTGNFPSMRGASGSPEIGGAT